MSDAWTALAGALGGALIPAGFAYLGIRYQSVINRQQRFVAREESFERAQSGYRTAYREFLEGVDALVTSPLSDATAPALRRAFYVCVFAGDPRVGRALLDYWSPDDREAGNPPSGGNRSDLEAAMLAHTTRDLAEHLKRARGGESVSA